MTPGVADINQTQTDTPSGVNRVSHLAHSYIRRFAKMQNCERDGVRWPVGENNGRCVHQGESGGVRGREAETSPVCWKTEMLRILIYI